MSPDNDPREFDDPRLPADLKQLGERLTLVAVELARQYPAAGQRAAKAPSQEPASSASPPRGVWWIGGGAAALLLATLAFSSFDADPSGGERRQASGSVANIQPGPLPGSGSSAAAIGGSPIRVYPVNVEPAMNAPHAQVSAPEWEAVLDLTPEEHWEGIELSL